MARIRSVFWSRDVKSGFQLVTLRQLRERDLRPGLAEPQRLDFHMLILCENGVGAHMVDFEMHDCRRGTLIHISPNQVHAFASDIDTEATLLIFRPEVLPVEFYGPDSGTQPPAEYLWPPATKLDKPSLEFVTATVSFLTKQHCSQGIWDHPEAARHVAIGLASLAYRTAVSSSPLYQSPPQPLFFAFLTIVEEFYATRRDAQWYARRLDCSYRNLCRICKEASGETPKTMIDRRVAIESRRLLAFTQDSALEIGKCLGFTEATNFVKFFQRLAGSTPDVFRRQWQK
ncbi:AraC family transcriptional regulator [Bremerella alba]|uniref:HTH-type transcriptional activator RhaS n=1 Tax=Bremerella alba TaxID=980252 RepID=A0A7V8V375_9BACT|nr:helix-turn-helix transcriptional regulator [Bremerella alba]MBA2114109.1 HTH-type transcriptional activator RhaS [Bremerella alba]